MATHLQRARTFCFRKCHPQVLSRYYGMLFPPEAAEAFRIAEANVKIIRARAYNTEAKADKHALDEARWKLIRMIVSRFNLRRVMSNHVDRCA